MSSQGLTRKVATSSTLGRFTVCASMYSVGFSFRNFCRFVTSYSYFSRIRLPMASRIAKEKPLMGQLYGPIPKEHVLRQLDGNATQHNLTSLSLNLF